MSPTYRMWMPVRGHEGSYEVSSDGMVRSLDRVVGSRRLKGKLLRQSNIEGYPSVHLRGSKGKRAEYVHRLVASSFIGLPDPGQEVRHLDGTRTNNRVENLSWGTRKENCSDTIAHGRTTRGRKNEHAVLGESEVKRIRSLGLEYGAERLAEEFGVAKSTVYGILNRGSWTWLD